MDAGFYFLPRTTSVRFSFVRRQPSVKQSFLFNRQRFVIVKPTVSVKFGELDTDFVSFVGRKLAQFFQNLCLGHKRMIRATTAPGN